MLKRILTASILMILTMVFLSYLNHGEIIKPNKPLAKFPKEIGEWVGKEDHFDKKVLDLLGVDDSFLAEYKAPNGRVAQLYIGFYQSQREGDLIHSPKNCMPGAGWNIVETSLVNLMMPSHNPGKIKLIKLSLQKGGQRQIALYWFQSRGRFIASEYIQKIYLVVDSIVKHRTDGSFVRLIAPVESDNEDETLESLKNFAKLIIPILQEYIPS